MQNVNIQPVINIDNKTLKEIKKLCINITLLHVKVINVTSVTSGEGKSMISFWLAKTLSDIGKKVILVDANIGKNDSNTIYKINDVNNKGLSDFLMGNESKEDIIYGTNYKNFDIMLSGHSQKDSTEIFVNSKMKDLINFLSGTYEYVIIDTPAVGEATDGVIIASYADGSILVIEPEIVDYELAIKVKNQFKNSGIKLLGAVINKV